MNIKNKLLLLVLVLAGVLRLYQLGNYPIHLTNDEAGIGYNAYSILKTGRDEFGEFLPVVFKSFGDWKPGLYIYTTVPSIFIFGLSEFSVRLPSALAGVLAVFMVYRIANILFNRPTAISSAFMLAIMPWHIQFSRGAWEANLALTLLLVAVWFFLEGIKNQRALLISSMFFGLTLWTYQSAKLASLLVLVVLVVIYYKDLFKISPKYLISSFVVGVIVAIPIISSLFSGKGGRIEVMSLFSYTRPEKYIEESVLAQENIDKSNFVFTLYHSEELNFARGIAGRYFNYFSGRFLFFEGDWSSLRHSLPNVGYLLFAEVPILIVGLFHLFRERDKKGSAFILLWLCLAPIPGAITRDSIHGVRGLNLAIPMAVILGVGLERLFRFRYRALVLGIGTVLFLYSVAIYLDAFYLQNKFVNAENYFYGYRETVNKLSDIQGSKNVIFDQSFDQPYIFFLFYNKYDPSTYQKSLNFTEGINGDVGLVTRLDKIEFRPINWSADRELEDTLIVGKPGAFPAEELKENYAVSRVKYPSGQDAFLIVEPI